jgi:lycopene cyclase domain-containing protein
MCNYALIDAIFLALAFVISLLTLKVHHVRRWVITLLIMVALTAVFDSIIISLNIVAYEPQHLLGFRIGRAPIEDFGYTIASVIVTPCIWQWQQRHHARKAS